MKKATINLYSFTELNEDAKQKAIIEHADFMESVGNEYEEENGEMKTDYTRPTDEETVENIEANDYIYFNDGSLTSCVTYVGKHEKAGITELKFYNEIYTVS